MHGAHEMDERAAPEITGWCRDSREKAGLPMPKVYIMDNPQPNAFATGRNPENAAVAVTTGLLDRLSQDEVAGVIAHELAHVKNRDTLTMTVTATHRRRHLHAREFRLHVRRQSQQRRLGLMGGCSW